MNTEFKQVAFDIGNVLFRVDLDRFIGGLYQYGFVKSKIAGQRFLDKILIQQDLGFCSIKDALCDICPDNPNIDLMESKWINTLIPSKPMINFIEELLNNYWQVALLSNIGIDHATFIRNNFPTLNHCIQHFSFEVGARKPSKLFYQSFFLSRNPWAKGFPFFDDLDINIEAAYSEGFNVYKFDLNSFENDEKAVEYLRRVLGLDI